MTILTGSEIHRQWELGAIVIDPFDPARLNPNSYNFTLGREVLVYTGDILDARRDNLTAAITIADDGLILEPGQLYLAHTGEVLGGTQFAPTFAARSSIARMGLSIHLSSGLGDIGYLGHWTLQLVATQPVRVYPGMTIGQMMWWEPEGELTVYNGKYQGAQGPRPSMSYRSLDLDIARDRFPILRPHDFHEHHVGAKAANLARMLDVSGDFTVPDAIIIPAGEFRAALQPATMETLADIFADVAATVGANLAEDTMRAERTVETARMSTRARDLLATQMSDVFRPECRFAVRSSAIGEDSVRVSHAGAYHSHLDVAAADVPDAVARVWRSYYGLTAVTGRVRTGDYDPTPRMAVIVQRLIEPDVAGIAMTGLDPNSPEHVVIEAVAGRGDELAVGVIAATVNPARLLTADQLRAVQNLTHTAAQRLGHPAIDIEWAIAEAHLHLLQARPNTAPTAIEQRGTPTLLRLYDDPIPNDIPLGPVTVTCLHYIAKRSAAARLATQVGISRGGAWLLYIPPGRPVDITLPTLPTESQVVIDASEYVRQVVIDYTDLPDKLRTLRAVTPMAEPLTVLVRQYLIGDYGVITRRAPDHNSLYIEACPEGLLAMNRGIGTTTVFTIPTDAEPDQTAVDLLGGPDNVDLIKTFTHDVEELLGPLAIEWVIESGDLHYVDHTVLNETPSPVTTTDGVMISPGRCVGRVVALTDDELLHRLSVAPAVSVDGGVDVSSHRLVAEITARLRAAGSGAIIHASKPYAILAAFTGQASGFLFDTAPLLCHLAIILREQRIPAAIHHAAEGQELMLDDGTVHTITGGARLP